LSKKKKRPKSREKIKPQKKPKTDSSISPDTVINKKPAWRFGKIDFEGEWGFDKINKSSILKNLHQKLKNFEGMTWGEIERKTIKKGSKLNHSIFVEKISKEAKNRFKKIRLADEYDTLYSFHLAGKERLWGIRENEIFYIIWWDKEHTVYPVHKRS